MSASILSFVAFAIIFGGALLGMLLRRVLPELHLNADSKEVVRLATGLLATLAALVIGLLIASAQSSFQTRSNQIKQITANIILLDNLLARSGADAQPLRPLLRSGVKVLVDRIWREPDTAKAAPFEASAQSDIFFDKLLELTPQNDGQRVMQTRALQIWLDLAQTRVLFAQTGSAIPMPFLAVLVFWLAAIFVSFGMFTRPNPTIISALIVCAISAASAIFLILELGYPFGGVMEISSAPLSNALAVLSP
jgi:hypothetical protein